LSEGEDPRDESIISVEIIIVDDEAYDDRGEGRKAKNGLLESLEVVCCEV